MTDDDKTGFTVGFTVGAPNEQSGPSVDFMVGLIKLLGRKYGNRLMPQAVWDAWISPLGKIEAEYRSLAPFTRKKRSARTSTGAKEASHDPAK